MTTNKVKNNNWYFSTHLLIKPRITPRAHRCLNIIHDLIVAVKNEAWCKILSTARYDWNGAVFEGPAEKQMRLRLLNAQIFFYKKSFEGKYLFVWDLKSAWGSDFAAGVPIGAKGWDTLFALNPVDTSMFVKFLPSLAAKSERTLFAPCPHVEADILFELVKTIAFCEVEWCFFGSCHKQ